MSFSGLFQLKGLPSPALLHPFFFKEKPRSLNRESIFDFWDFMICIASGEYIPSHIIVNLKKNFLWRILALTNCGVIVIMKLTPELPILDFDSRVFSAEKGNLYLVYYLNLLNLSLLFWKECYDLTHQWCNHFIGVIFKIKMNTK